MPRDCESCFWCVACRMSHCRDEGDYDCAEPRVVEIAGTGVRWRTGRAS